MMKNITLESKLSLTEKIGCPQYVKNGNYAVAFEMGDIPDYPDSGLEPGGYPDYFPGNYDCKSGLVAVTAYLLRADDDPWWEHAIPVDPFGDPFDGEYGLRADVCPIPSCDSEDCADSDHWGFPKD